tara:strand:+ start:1616 stop:1717 length:102 start_codon:yes stop_codon:yes gene_type:complete
MQREERERERERERRDIFLSRRFLLSYDNLIYA